MLCGVDSAYPAPDPTRLKALGYDFAAGYIGGNALNVWTPDQWRAHRDAGLLLVPIWVAPYGVPSYQQGVDDGNAALVAMQQLNFSGAVAADVENGADPVDYLEGFVSACHAGKCSVVLYGSKLTLAGSGVLVDAWWLADWVQSGIGLRQAPPDWSMWQYATGPQFDYNVAVNGFPFAQLGV